MTRVVPAAAAMKMEWDKDVEYPPETASRWLSHVRESLTTIYFTPNMLDWYVNRSVAEPTIWPWPLTTRMALIMDFHGQILK